MKNFEEESVRPWMVVMLILGLTVLTAAVCAVLWYSTHRDKAEEGGGNSLAEAETSVSESSEESLPEQEPTESESLLSEEEEEEGEEKQSEESIPPEEGEEESEQVTGTMVFTEKEDQVTPKEAVNLRSAPTTADDGNIVVQVKNGELLTRTGINEDTGWSRLQYGEQTVYAGSRYLTGNMEYSPPKSAQPANPNRVNTAEGRSIDFTDCDDWISPKEYVNLRIEPSTVQGNATVSCRMEYGDKAHRTGCSEDSGWSRVEYDGKVLYVVTSLIYEVEP